MKAVNPQEIAVAMNRSTPLSININTDECVMGRHAKKTEAITAPANKEVNDDRIISKIRYCLKTLRLVLQLCFLVIVTDTPFYVFALNRRRKQHVAIKCFYIIMISIIDYNVFGFNGPVYVFVSFLDRHGSKDSV